MSIQVKSIDVYGIEDRLRKSKNKEDKEVWQYEREWVKNQGILLDRQIGDEVSVNINRKPQTGKIVSLYHEKAQYGVRTPEQKETENWVINFEDILS